MEDDVKLLGSSRSNDPVSYSSNSVKFDKAASEKSKRKADVLVHENKGSQSEAVKVEPTLESAVRPGPSVVAIESDSSSSSRLQEGLEKSISDEVKQHVAELLKDIGKLTDVEKLLLYLKLPKGSPPVQVQDGGTPVTVISRQDQSNAVTWIRSHLQEDPGISIPKHEVYNEYRAYCDKHRMKSVSQADFGKIMKIAFPNIKPRRLGNRGNSQYCYAGLRSMQNPTPPIVSSVTTPVPNTSQGQAPKPETEVSTATNAVICEWAQKLLGRSFSNLQEIAVYLISNMYVNNHSIAAFAVLGRNGKEAQLDAGPSKVPSADRHKETQMQLKRKVQERALYQQQRQKLLEQQQENLQAKIDLDQAAQVANDGKVELSKKKSDKSDQFGGISNENESKKTLHESCDNRTQSESAAKVVESNIKKNENTVINSPINVRQGSAFHNVANMGIDKTVSSKTTAAITVQGDLSSLPVVIAVPVQTTMKYRYKLVQPKPSPDASHSQLATDKIISKKDNKVAAKGNRKRPSPDNNVESTTVKAKKPVSKALLPSTDQSIIRPKTFHPMMTTTSAVGAQPKITEFNNTKQAGSYAVAKSEQNQTQTHPINPNQAAMRTDGLLDNLTEELCPVQKSLDAEVAQTFGFGTGATVSADRLIKSTTPTRQLQANLGNNSMPNSPALTLNQHHQTTFRSMCSREEGWHWVDGSSGASTPYPPTPNTTPYPQHHSGEGSVEHSNPVTPVATGLTQEQLDQIAAIIAQHPDAIAEAFESVPSEPCVQDIGIEQRITTDFVAPNVNPFSSQQSCLSRDSPIFQQRVNAAHIPMEIASRLVQKYSDQYPTARSRQNSGKCIGTAAAVSHMHYSKSMTAMNTGEDSDKDLLDRVRHKSSESMPSFTPRTTPIPDAWSNARPSTVIGQLSNADPCWGSVPSSPYTQQLQGTCSNSGNSTPASPDTYAPPQPPRNKSDSSLVISAPQSPASSDKSYLCVSSMQSQSSQANSFIPISPHKFNKNSSTFTFNHSASNSPRQTPIMSPCQGAMQHVQQQVAPQGGNVAQHTSGNPALQKPNTMSPPPRGKPHFSRMRHQSAQSSMQKIENRMWLKGRISLPSSPVPQPPSSVDGQYSHMGIQDAPQRAAVATVPYHTSSHTGSMTELDPEESEKVAKIKDYLKASEAIPQGSSLQLSNNTPLQVRSVPSSPFSQPSAPSLTYNQPSAKGASRNLKNFDSSTNTSTLQALLLKKLKDRPT